MTVVLFATALERASFSVTVKTVVFIHAQNIIFDAKYSIKLIGKLKTNKNHILWLLYNSLKSLLEINTKIPTVKANT
jgi:hypothetical protein